MFISSTILKEREKWRNLKEIPGIWKNREGNWQKLLFTKLQGKIFNFTNYTELPANL